MSVIVSAHQVKWFLKQVNTGTVFEVDPSDFRVGRCNNAQVILNSTKTSRTHSSFVVNVEGHLLVQDLKSINGTFVNGIPIEVYVRHRVKHGDIISFGIDKKQSAENDKDLNTFFEVLMKLPEIKEKGCETNFVDSTTDIPETKLIIDVIDLVDEDEDVDCSLNNKSHGDQKKCVSTSTDSLKVKATSEYEDLNNYLKESLLHSSTDSSKINVELCKSNNSSGNSSNNIPEQPEHSENVSSDLVKMKELKTASSLDKLTEVNEHPTTSRKTTSEKPGVVKPMIEMMGEFSLGASDIGYMCSNQKEIPVNQKENVEPQLINPTDISPITLSNTGLNVGDKSFDKKFSTDKDVSVIIDITDDEGDDDFSCSQIFQMSERVKTEIQDDNFQKIKRELSEMDCFDEEFVLNQQPINLEDDFGQSGFENTQDICALLEEDLIDKPNNLPLIINHKEQENVDLNLEGDKEREIDKTPNDKAPSKKHAGKVLLTEPHTEVPTKRKSKEKEKPAENNRIKRKNSLEHSSNKKKLKGSVSTPLLQSNNTNTKHSEVNKRCLRSSSELDVSTKEVIKEERRKKLKKLSEASHNNLSDKKKIENAVKVKRLPETKTNRGSFLCEPSISSKDNDSSSCTNKETKYQLRPIDLSEISKPSESHKYNLRRSDNSVNSAATLNDKTNRGSLPQSYTSIDQIKQVKTLPVPELYRSKIDLGPIKPDVSVTSYPSSRLMYPHANQINDRRMVNRRMMSYNTDDIVHKIVHWLPHWLEEQINIDVSAPINNPPARKIPLNFSSSEEYYEVFSKLVLLEKWQFLFKGFRESKEQPQKAQIQHIRVSNDLLYIDCECYLTKEDVRRNSFYKAEDFLLLECKTKDTNHFYLSLHFGFVQRCKKTEVSQKHVQANLSFENVHSKLEFTILTRYLPQKQIDPKGTVLLKLLANIGGHLKQIKAIKGLTESPLCRMILYPKIDEYRFPITIQQIIHPNILNPRQTQIVLEAASLCTGNSSGIYCIKGPPGTGKTCVIVNLIFQILTSYYMTHETTDEPMILLAAPSNTAVDNMLSKLVAKKYSFPSEWDRLKNKVKLIRIGPESSISEEGIHYSLTTLAKKHVTLKNRDLPDFKVAKEKKENMVEFAKKYFGRRYIQEVKVCEDILVEKSNIICTTLNSCVNGKLVDAVTRGLIKFTCCIIDEATQCHEIESLLPTTLGIDKFVLVGDPKQLNATVMNREASSLGYGESLFSRISNNFVNDPRSPIKMLVDQYRMHPEICSFPNKAFYEGKLKSFPKHSNKLPDILKPYLVFSCDKFSESPDYTNIDEVNLIRRLLQGVLELVDNIHIYTFGIITPYNAQKDLINYSIKDLTSLKENCRITVNTVDSFQGSENDVIIISCVRYSTNSFLQNANRLNVALTRAKQALYIIGNYTLYKECRILYDLREDAKRRRVMIDIKQNPATIENFNKILVRK